MHKISNIFSAVAIFAAVIIAGAISAAWASTPYTDAAFKEAQASGAPILVEIHATWCPTCKAQTPIIEKLASDAKFGNLKIFRVDFDDQKAVVKNFGANMQSTLIVFKGTTEVGRSVGDTKPDSIAALLGKGL